MINAVAARARAGGRGVTREPPPPRLRQPAALAESRARLLARQSQATQGVSTVKEPAGLAAASQAQQSQQESGRISELQESRHRWPFRRNTRSSPISSARRICGSSAPRHAASPSFHSVNTARSHQQHHQRDQAKHRRSTAFLSPSALAAAGAAEEPSARVFGYHIAISDFEEHCIAAAYCGCTITPSSDNSNLEHAPGAYPRAVVSARADSRTQEKKNVSVCGGGVRGRCGCMCLVCVCVAW